MIGKQIGHYEVVSELGVGGMGQVYLAQDTELGRQVALKILPEDLAADPERLHRFRREARALAAVNHPNIVGVFSVDESDGVHFITMELVKGQTLAGVLEPGGLPLPMIFEIALPLSDALAEAHEQGIVHRDLKPGNVMVNEKGQLKVLDFGLATAPAAGPDEGLSQIATEVLTVEGAIVGTVPYMSPEQLEGKPVDARSDIFSLGVVLYELATGERPFSGDTPAALMSSILRDDPVDITERRPDLPRHLARIVRQCLEKRPEDRFQTARDVRNQLKTLRGETTTGVSATEVLAASAPRRSARPIAAIAAALGVALLGWGAWQFLGPSPPADTDRTGSPPAVEGRPLVVVLPFENMGEAEDQYFADGMTEEVISRLAVFDGLSVISRRTAMQYRDDRPSTSQLGEELGVDYILEGTVRWQKESDGHSRVRITPQLIRVSDDTPLWSERYDAVLADIFEVQSDVASQVSRELGVAVLEPQRLAIESRPTQNMEAYDLFLKGNDYLHRGREVNSGDELLIAVQMYEQAIALDPAFALAHARESLAHGWLYREGSDRSVERAQQALESAQRALDLDESLPDAHYALGYILSESDPDKNLALAELETALAGQPGNAEIYETIAFVHAHFGQWEKGLNNLRRAMELDPRSGRLPCWTGGSCFALRRYEEAKYYHDIAIKRTPDRSCAYACQAWIAMNREGGIERAREFLEGLPPTLGLEESPPLAYPWVTVEMMDGQWDEALARLDLGERVTYEFRLFYIPKDLLRAQIHAARGDAAEAARLYATAITHLEDAVERLPEDSRVRGSLAIAYAGAGRNEEAVQEAGKGLELLDGSLDEIYGHRLRDAAQVHLMVGDAETALDRIETLVSVPTFFSTFYVEADPAFDALHDHPRFLEIMERYRPAEDRRRAHV